MPTPIARVYPIQGATVTTAAASQAFFCPAGSEISVTIPMVGATINGAGTLDFSVSSLAAIQAGTATWQTSAVSYLASTTTPTKVYADCFVRFNATINQINVRIDPNGSTVPMSTQPLASGQFSTQDATALKALLSGGGIQYRGVVIDTYTQVTLDAGSGNVLPALRAVVNAPDDIIAAQRISDGLGDAVTTLMTGASTQGEVIPIGTSGVALTSVSVGSSLGTGQLQSGSNTITVNQIAVFVFDGSKALNQLQIQFGAPYGSGRYCTVTCTAWRAA